MKMKAKTPASSPPTITKIEDSRHTITQDSKTAREKMLKSLKAAQKEFADSGDQPMTMDEINDLVATLRGGAR